MQLWCNSHLRDAIGDGIFRGCAPKQRNSGHNIKPLLGSCSKAAELNCPADKKLKFIVFLHSNQCAGLEMLERSPI
jgi:hypothetical protein